MTVVGKKTKAGVSYARFGCTSHASRGASICAKSLSVSEKKASRALVDALQARLCDPAIVERFVAKFQETAAALIDNESTTTVDADRLIRECERRISNLTETLAKVGWSDAIAGKLKGEEGQLAKLKRERAQAPNQASRKLPDAATA